MARGGHHFKIFSSSSGRSGRSIPPTRPPPPAAVRPIRRRGAARTAATRSPCRHGAPDTGASGPPVSCGSSWRFGIRWVAISTRISSRTAQLSRPRRQRPHCRQFSSSTATAPCNRSEWLWHLAKQELAFLCKTYPSRSVRYAKTSCVAGLEEAGKLIRLYPVPFRLIATQPNSRNGNVSVRKSRRRTKIAGRRAIVLVWILLFATLSHLILVTGGRRGGNFSTALRSSTPLLNWTRLALIRGQHWVSFALHAS